MRDAHLIAGAILLGNALIAASIYFAPHPAAAPPPPPAVPPPPPIAAPAPAPDPTPRAIADATRALQAKKPELIAACWEPALRKDPKPDRASYRYSLSFDASGRQIGMGVSEIRDASRADVAACLRARPLDLGIPPPGRVVNLEVMLDLP